MVSRLPPSSPETEDEQVAEAERLLQQGEPLLAYNVADAGALRWPGNVRLRRLQALALARSGDAERANRLLSELAQAGTDDVETLGVLAGTHKELGVAERDVAQRDAHLEAAYRLYAQGYATSVQRGAAASAYYTGINAATMAVLHGQIDEARWLAADVQRICSSSPAGNGDDGAEYWRQATLGEAALILGDAPAATRHYADAMALAHGRYGDLSKTRRQARMLASHLAIDDTWLEEVLRIPPVLVCTGHMIDQPGRVTPRFPAELEAVVAGAIDSSIDAIRPVAAYGSAACGADILCLERVQALGGETHVVLPFPPEEFRHTSVEFANGNWGARFERLLASAHSITITSDHRATGSVAPYEYANLVFTGMGQLRAQLLDTVLFGLAVWDRRRGAPGGAASLVSAWERRGIRVQHVQLEGLRPAGGPPTDDGSAGTDAAHATEQRSRHRIKSLLFADAVGYSLLTEDQIPLYVEVFLGAVADLNRRTRYRCEHVETAGDGFYMVFAAPEDAARYAIELRDMVSGTDWAAQGLPPTFGLRIALHCGPVYCGVDPVTGTPLYTGPHTSRAARIEPVTPPGQVYASRAFAAVAAARGVDGIAMRYVGRTPLAKRSGSLDLYHLQRAR
jgi:hypothetical protein